MKVVSFLFFTLLFVFSAIEPLHAQSLNKAKRKLEKFRRDNWPSSRSYSRISLGYALQKKFKQHTEYCGFDIPNGKKDYVPKDISKFLGRRTLRTKVETADITGGGLMSYIFTREDLRNSFNEVNYIPSRVIRLNSVSNQFVINPDENFDSFILTKNCSGYLKAALDAGIEPPYVAFKTALDTDTRRESSILALSGSFVSPLKLILDAKDARTTESLMQLWAFYNDHPSFVNNAYFLREFEGVLIKHSSSSTDNNKIESEVGININGILPLHLRSRFGISYSNANTFSGNDWETIIFTDFAGSYTKENLFEQLPSPNQISQYFAHLKPIYEKARDFPLMTEGLEHKHYLIIEGIPESMTQNFWELEDVQPGVYEGQPKLKATYFSDKKTGAFGCRFTIAGRPVRNNFIGPLTNRPGKLTTNYTIRSRQPVGGSYLRFQVQEEIQTSSHPIAAIKEGEFDLSKKEDRRFAFQWEFVLDIEDQENPVDFNVFPYIDNLEARNSDQNLRVVIADIRPDPMQKQYFITLETLDTYALDQINDSNMKSYNLSMDVHLQGARSRLQSVRPLKGIISFPSIRKPPMEKSILEPFQNDPNFLKPNPDNKNN